MNLKPLLDILEQEQKLHDKLLLAKREERKFIATADATSILKNTEQINDWIEEIKRAETRREHITRQLARDLGIDGERCTLNQILEAVPPEQRSALEHSRRVLKQTIESIREINKANHLLLHRSVVALGEQLKSILQTNTDTGVYTKSGSKARRESTSAGLNVKV